LKESGRGLIQHYFDICLKGLRKTRKNLIKTTGVAAEIRTKHTSPASHRVGLGSSPGQII
jgi:hypothetical protein